MSRPVTDDDLVLGFGEIDRGKAQIAYEHSVSRGDCNLAFANDKKSLVLASSSQSAIQVIDMVSGQIVNQF